MKTKCPQGFDEKANSAKIIILVSSNFGILLVKVQYIIIDKSRRDSRKGWESTKSYEKYFDPRAAPDVYC